MFDLHLYSFTYPDTPDAKLFDRTVEIARTAEESGFDSISLMDHLQQVGLVGGRDEPILEAYVGLGALATATTTLRLGAVVTGVVYRNPALLAKMVTTLDVVSGGRAYLGIGASWNVDEQRAYGYDVVPWSERFDRLEEAVQICRLMLNDDKASFSGRHYRVEDALNYPRPIQPGGIPLLIGGSGERRTLRLVAQYADMCNIFGGRETIRHKLSVLDRRCDEVGRDPATIVRTKSGRLVVTETQAEAERIVADEAARSPWGREAYMDDVIAGEPDAVAEQIQSYLDIGLDGYMFMLPSELDLDTVRLAGEAIRKVRHGRGD
jgi:F420-dependent oxidoreductase-like protein